MKTVAIVATVLIIFLLWGLIGSSQVSKVGNTCDFGINDDGNILCWIWHKNIVGDFNDFADENLQTFDYVKGNLESEYTILHF